MSAVANQSPGTRESLASRSRVFVKLALSDTLPLMANKVLSFPRLSAPTAFLPWHRALIKREGSHSQIRQYLRGRF